MSPTRGVEAAMRLLADDNVDPPNPGQRSEDAAGLAMLAIESVMPRNLAGVSVERILTMKDDLGEELAAFRSFIADQQPEMERLAGIRSLDIRAEAFAAHLNTQVKEPLKRLERGLRLQGFDTFGRC